MSLKGKILWILFAASVVFSMIAGICLIQLLAAFGAISGGAGAHPAAIAASIIIFLLGGIVLLLVFSVLINKHVIIPSVEREFMEKERAVLAKQLQHAQKMESLGKLAGSIAHDFNNLLTIIDGYSSLIIANPQGKQTGQHAQEVVDAARRATSITRKLMNFSRNERKESVLIDLNNAVCDAEKMLLRLVGEKITLVVRVSGEPVLIKIDPVQVEQLLMNLAVNARDAMPHGGRISIGLDCRVITDDECGKPSKLPDGRYAEISFRDSGCGMDEKVMARIFEAFYTTKHESHGTGLGLSIVKSILKEHHGFADVESAPGKGTLFFLYLPIAEPTEKNEEEQNEEPMLSEVPHESTEEVSHQRGSATILLAEDDPMIRELVEKTLTQQGYTVLTAEDGWEGIKIARTHTGGIDLLFSDIVMPGLGGSELAIAMKELYPQIKILFMSGYSRTQLQKEELPEDMVLLEKPFTTDMILSSVEELLNDQGS
ncbi:MAG: response regulator [Pontiellaceae bacterium]|nr:response regulator [Pontiellaceae bacterium]